MSDRLDLFEQFQRVINRLMQRIWQLSIDHQINFKSFKDLLMHDNYPRILEFIKLLVTDEKIKSLSDALQKLFQKLHRKGTGFGFPTDSRFTGEWVQKDTSKAQFDDAPHSVEKFHYMHRRQNHRIIVTVYNHANVKIKNARTSIKSQVCEIVY